MGHSCGREWQSQEKAVSCLPHSSATSSHCPELEEVAFLLFSATHWPITPTVCSEAPSHHLSVLSDLSHFLCNNLHFSIWLCHTACGWISWGLEGENYPFLPGQQTEAPNLTSSISLNAPPTLASLLTPEQVATIPPLSYKSSFL